MRDTIYSSYCLLGLSPLQRLSINSRGHIMKRIVFGILELIWSNQRKISIPSNLRDEPDGIVEVAILMTRELENTITQLEV